MRNAWMNDVIAESQTGDISRKPNVWHPGFQELYLFFFLHCTANMHIVYNTSCLFVCLFFYLILFNSFFFASDLWIFINYLFDFHFNDLIYFIFSVEFCVLIAFITSVYSCLHYIFSKLTYIILWMTTIFNWKCVGSFVK